MLAAALIAVLCFRFVVTLRTDMADFLPQGGTPPARLMLDQLRSGPATSLILIGIEGAPPVELARISRAMTAALDASGRFAFVGGDQQGLDETDEQFLFAHRYLLSDVTMPAAFAVPALRQDFERLLQGLASSAAPVVEQFGLADPPGAFLAIARSWIGESGIRQVDGVWFAPHRDRALILCRSKVNGLDLAGQDAVAGAIATAFASARPGGARLLASGPAVFAREAARNIRSDISLISILSTVLIVGLLIWRFRSPLVIAAIAVPILLSISVAAAAVQLAFGFVHGIAFGFGMTMLGVTVDYPVLLVGHRKRGEAAGGTIRRIGPAFNLAAATAALGLLGMVFSGFPGLAQLGLFSVVVVLTAAAATRFLLPPLIVAADLAPVAAGEPSRTVRIEAVRAWRLWGLLPVAAAGAYLLAVGGPRFETALANLSPVPVRALALDAELRRELGAPDVGEVLVLQGQDAEAVLQQETALLPVLDRLQSEKIIAGAEIAARFLPSAATQLARRAALPAADALAANVAAAQAGLPFRSEAFRPFERAVAATRSMAPVTPADLAGPVIAARLAPLIFPRGGAWYGLVIPSGVTDSGRLAGALQGFPGATFVDIGTESNRIVARSTSRAGRWLAASAAAALLLLAVGLRDPRRVARVVGAIGAAGLITVAVLTAAGERLSLIHIVSLQFVAGIGLDYALFYARRQLDAEERARTLRTLATCNAMTLLTFGLLAFCRTPLLREIGATVAIGAVAAMAFGFLFVGERPKSAPA